MNIEIEYCGMCGYEPRARAARDLMLKTDKTATVTLKKSGGGVFEITVDGKLAYSKKASGAFPDNGQILATLT